MLRSNLICCFAQRAVRHWRHFRGLGRQQRPTIVLVVHGSALLAIVASDGGPQRQPPHWPDLKRRPRTRGMWQYDESAQHHLGRSAIRIHGKRRKAASSESPNCGERLSAGPDAPSRGGRAARIRRVFTGINPI